MSSFACWVVSMTHRCWRWRAIASAWPNLTFLDVGGEPYLFQSLIHLIYGYPKLVTLDIFVDTEDLPGLSSILPSSHTLQSLSLTIPVSYNIDCILLARLVDRMFPNLQNISVGSSDPCSVEDMGYLKSIPSAIKAFQAIREEYRSGLMT